MEKPRCFNCHFCVGFDEGWSNYTVENTMLHCLLELNPGMPCEESYSWLYPGTDSYGKIVDHPTFAVAETCPSYQHTEQIITIDVEREDLASYDSDPIFYQLLLKASAY